MSLRKEFSIPPETYYFNCAAQGPITQTTAAAIQRGIEDKLNPARISDNHGFELAHRARVEAAQLVCCPTDWVAMANSTSWGVNAVAQSFPFKDGDEVLVFEGQFPSNVAPWELLKSRGVRLKKIPCRDFICEVDELRKHLTKRTKVVSLEWVHFMSGDRIHLREMCEAAHEAGAFVVADITQGLGAIPFDFKKSGLDVAFCSGYKWLLSPYGTGFLAMTPEANERLGQPMINWQNLKCLKEGRLAHFESDYEDSVRRFDIYGSSGFLNLDGFGAALKQINEEKLPSQFEELFSLCGLFRDGLDKKSFRCISPQAKERRSLIVSFAVPDLDLPRFKSELNTLGIFLTAREGIVRISPFVFNSHSQVERAVDLINAGTKRYRIPY